MEENKFLKIFAICAFLVLMFVSCWATVESLHMLEPGWPVPFFWAVTIIFFVVTSIGTKIIVDSFNQRICIDNRGWRLIGGIILLLVFWFVSFFTNPHTFFYNSIIKGELNSELVTVEQHLKILLNDGQAKILISKEKTDFESKVNAIFINLENEIKDKNNEGYGPRAKQCLSDLKTALGLKDVKIQEPKWSSTPQGRLNTIESLRNQKNACLNEKLNEYDNRISLINIGINKEEIGKKISILQNMQTYLQNNGKIDEKFRDDAKNILRSSITTVNTYFDNLKNNWGYEEKSPYLSNEPEIVRIERVIDVWSDYFHGKFAGRGFLYWIILGALVDIAGFIFFDVAFRYED